MFILEDNIKELENKIVELEKQLKNQQVKREELAKLLQEFKNEKKQLENELQACEKNEKYYGKKIEMYLLTTLFEETILSNESFNDSGLTFIKDVLKIENFQQHNNPAIERSVEMMNYFAENISEIKNLLKVNPTIENFKWSKDTNQEINSIENTNINDASTSKNKSILPKM